MLSLYYAFIHTYVNYANLAWASTTRPKLKKIHNEQKHAIHIFILKDTSPRTKGLFVQNKVFNVDQLNILNNLNFMHKVNTETSPAIFLTKYQEQAHPYAPNFSKLNYVKPTSQLSRPKHKISVRGPAL